MGRPNLIVGEKENLFEHMQFTHFKKQGHKSNIKMDKNINKNDLNDCYIQKRIYMSKKNKFGKKITSLEVSENDFNKVISWLNKRNK